MFIIKSLQNLRDVILFIIYFCPNVNLNILPPNVIQAAIYLVKFELGKKGFFFILADNAHPFF